MTPTEELRAMLDERGVEWNAIDGDDICFTEWRTHGGAFVYTARESFRSYRDNDLRVETCGIPRSCLIATPEQAIDATLGTGTCKLTQASLDDDICTWGCICSACDAHLEHETGIGYNFCPICGAKVVSE